MTTICFLARMVSAQVLSSYLLVPKFCFDANLYLVVLNGNKRNKFLVVFYGSLLKFLSFNLILCPLACHAMFLSFAYMRSCVSPLCRNMSKIASTTVKKKNFENIHNSRRQN